MKVGIIGLGIVGQAQVRMFAGHDVVTYDKAHSSHYPFAELAECNFAVICVDTPPLPDGSADLRNLNDALAQLPAGLPVLIRSTVPPGTTGKIEWMTCHAPEFLHERKGGAWQESADVPFLILGGKPAAREFFAYYLCQVYPGTIYECDALTAELVKYTANAHWAARVTFVNEMARVAQSFGADWESVREAWLQDERVSPAYTQIAGFEPGFDGRCWPKDLTAIARAAQEAGYEAEFLQAILRSNDRFRSGR